MPYKDKAKRNEAIKKSQAKKPEKYKALRRGYGRKRSHKGYLVEWRYGIDADEYLAMVERQGDKCAICRREVPLTKSGRSGLHVDHNHETGKVRGLLCPRCNCFVGYIEATDSAELLRKTRSYLDNS